ncbi:hypothetical protein [Photorhabdus viridis]|uniref:hypothetical protein n=1 Tax=Photorhabdus viridis TaxID=3163327 RepID=UPI003306EFB3
MSNIRSKPNNITPQLVYMWERSNEPWRAKDCQSKFIYVNPAFYQRLNLPENFDITRISTDESPSPIAEYEEEYYHQDQKIIQTMRKVTSMETLTQTSGKFFFSPFAH